MTFLVDTPITDSYVDDFIAKAKTAAKYYDIKELTGDLTILKKVIKKNLRNAKTDYDNYANTFTPEENLSTRLYEAYKLLDTLIRGAKEVKEK